MYLRRHDALIVANRPAVFLEWKWKGRVYADILYIDNNERGTCHQMDIQPLTQAIVDAMLAAGFESVEAVTP